MIVREVHETVKHIAHVRRLVPAVFEGQRYEMPAPDSTRTLCDKPINNGIADGELGDSEVDFDHWDAEMCDVCRTQHQRRIAALYYGEDGE
jgi:hypothetical protein